MFQVLLSFFVYITQQYGILTSIITFGFIVGLFAKHRKFFSKLIKFFKKDKFIYKKFFQDNQGFNQQIIFIRLQYLLNVRIKQINCSCPLRKQLYKTIFTIKINKFLSGLKDFVKQDINVLDNQMFKIKLVNFLQQKHLQWKETCLKNKVPQFVIESIDYQIQDLRNMFYTNIQRIINNVYLYSNNRQKLNVILDLFLGLQQNILNVCEQVLSSFNGQVKKLHFNGVKCKECVNCVHQNYLKMQRIRLKGQKQK